MKIPLTFGNYKGRSGAANAMELINLMVESEEQGGSANYVLIGTPGCKEYADTGIEAEGRGGYSLPDVTLCVVGDTLFAIAHSTKVATILGTLQTSTGFVQWAENPDEVMLIDSAKGYVYTKSTQAFAIIADFDFPGIRYGLPAACTFKDGFGVVVEADTGKFYVSAINDFTSWGTLDFTTAEYEPDNLVSCLSSHDSLFAFGVKTTQTYYNSGNSSFPFDNRPGANMQIGCGAASSPAKGENIIFWLDQHGVVRKLDGYSQVIISTRQIEYLISQLSTFADAKGFVYVMEGHTFYVLIFPTDKLTLVYDLSTAQWHKRTSYASHRRWRPAWITQFGATVLAGDFGNGKIYQLDSATYQDNSDDISWSFTLQDINADDHMMAHDMLSLDIESGVGLINGQGSDPMLWMTYSDDDGKTWSHEKWRSMGKIGETHRRIKFYALGRSRSRVYKISGTDPVKKVIVSARLEGRSLGY